MMKVSYSDLRGDFKQEIDPVDYRRWKARVHNKKVYADMVNNTMGLIFIGDIHGDFEFFHMAKKQFDHNIPLTFIQVGDFGINPNVMHMWPTGFPWPVYFIDGNHEYFPWLENYTEVTEISDPKHPEVVYSNLFYVPRGTIMELAGYKIGFMGGGMSLDKHRRTKGVNWFPEEEVTEEQVALLYGKELDILVTHAAPAEIALIVCGPLNKDWWGLRKEDHDHSADRIQRLWNNLDRPSLICGHLHRSSIGPNYRVLDIGEVYTLSPKQ